MTLARRFSGTARLYGESEAQRWSEAKVTVIGLGGVGSWAVEALARSGIGELHLVDMDVLSESNINRQLAALDSTLGRNKTDVLAARCQDINPQMKISVHDVFLDEDNIQDLLTPVPDLVLDCCDDFSAKKLLVLWCRRRRIPIVLAGATGGKKNPGALQLQDLAHTEQDPLLAKLRRELRRQHKFPADPSRRFGIATVFSSEPVQPPPQCLQGNLSCTGLGSTTVVTCSMAMLMVAEGLRLMSHRMQLRQWRAAQPPSAPT